MANIWVNGQHLVLGEITGNGRDTTGIASITVPVVVPTLALALTLSAAAVATAVGLANVRVTGQPFSQNESGEYQVNFTFEGIAAEGEWSFDRAQEEATYEFEGSMNEDPIQTHPDFFGDDGLATKYNWDFDEEKFRRQLAAEANTRGLSIADAKDKAPTNPLFGVDSYLAIGGVFRRTLAVRSIPPSIYEGIGEIIKRPPGIENVSFPNQPKRNFLKLCPKVSARGAALQISDEYLLSGPRGWEVVIYRFRG